MPLGFTRLNEVQQRPNPNVNFYKPLDGPDKDASLEFLSRIAAIASPIMRQNQCLVNSLEEFPPNREFWGRNFNAGECIQLVLKSPSTGRWLPRRFVEMVFMHELAHCKQMNHSRAFWKVRNAYSTELRDLWAKNYIGDGVWGQGHSLYDGRLVHQTLPAADEDMVRNLCGGTYRGRGKRRKATKSRPSYAEQKQKRIAKKFGTGGQELGNDEEARIKLENGKKTKGKPRVAGSNRGRELRAAALLDRLEKAKTEAVKKEETESETEDESDYEELPPDANEIVDSNGKRFIQVCEGEHDDQDAEAQNELQELFQGSEVKGNNRPQSEDASQLPSQPIAGSGEIGCYVTSHARNVDAESNEDLSEQTHDSKDTAANAIPDQKGDISPPDNKDTLTGPQSMSNQDQRIPAANGGAGIMNGCPICSLSNASDALICAACGHVLWPDKLHGTWQCTAQDCVNGKYVNHGDNGICGLCGASKQVS